MNLRDVVYSPTGLIHLIAAVVSLVTGTAVLLLEMERAYHTTIGYIYIMAMPVNE